MRAIKTFLEVELPHIGSQVLVYLKVYAWTAVMAIFIVGCLYVFQWATGYHVVITNVVSPIPGR